MQALVSNHRIERVTGDVKNYKVVRNTRRDIARIRTLMNEAKKQPTTSSTEEKAK
jgi:ribosomal protein L29